MLGWTILFGLLSLAGAIPAALRITSAHVAMTTASFLFAFLFVACLLTQLFRSPA